MLLKDLLHFSSYYSIVLFFSRLLIGSITIAFRTNLRIRNTEALRILRLGRIGLVSEAWHVIMPMPFTFLAPRTSYFL